MREESSRNNEAQNVASHKSSSFADELEILFNKIESANEENPGLQYLQDMFNKFDELEMLCKAQQDKVAAQAKAEAEAQAKVDAAANAKARAKAEAKAKAKAAAKATAEAKKHEKELIEKKEREREEAFKERELSICASIGMWKGRFIDKVMRLVESYVKVKGLKVEDIEASYVKGNDFALIQYQRSIDLRYVEQLYNILSQSGFPEIYYNQREAHIKINIPVETGMKNKDKLSWESFQMRCWRANCFIMNSEITK